jgi:tRNA dimethylallyltransferase
VAVERGTVDTRRYARRQVIFAKKYLVGPDWRWIERAEEVV